MSVVEFSADAWQASSPRLQGGLARRLEAVQELAQGLQGLAVSGQVSGRGADAMRAYIVEVHGPLLRSLLVGLSTFQTAIGVYWAGYAQVDTDGNFRLVRDEFQAHLRQLGTGTGTLQKVASQLRKIAGDAAQLVSLGAAGAVQAERTVEELERMHAIVKGQLETWEAYEAADHGFAQVQALVAELGRVVKNVGGLTVGRGRSYQAGSFRLSAQALEALTAGMVEYCQANQDTATEGWNSAFDGFKKDLEAAEKARREQAGWDAVWDGLQVVAGALITVVGLGLTPFTGGSSLLLTGLGAAMVIGGINNGINHYSIATTGQEFDLAGMAAQWWDANVAKPVASVSPFTGGVLSGVGHALAGMAQFSVKDAVSGAWNAVTAPTATLEELWNQLAETGAKVISGDWYAAGQIAGELAGLIIPGAVAAKAARAAGVVGKAGELAGGLAKPGNYLPGAGVGVKPLSIPGAVGKTVQDIGDRASAATRPIRDDFAPGEKPAWTPHPDNPTRPGDAHYGDPIPDHGVHRPYPTVNDTNKGTFDLVTDPGAPWGRDKDGTPYTKAEYDARFTEATTDSNTGHHYDHYPPNDGAVPGTRRDYLDLAAFVRDNGNAVDRIGEPTGPYLGLMKDGEPASFEQRGLPVNSLEKPYNSYRLAETWPPGSEGWSIEISDVAGAFGRDGGAKQILIRDEEGNKVTIQELLKKGILLPRGANK